MTTTATATNTVNRDPLQAAPAGMYPVGTHHRGGSPTSAHALTTAGTDTGTSVGAPTTRSVASARTEELLGRLAGLPAADPGRAEVRARAIESSLPLARAAAIRYQGRGEPFDDLYQVAALALVRAVDAYDPARQVAFASYAMPCIIGALKRHFRDSTWALRIPRPVQDLAIRLSPASGRLTQQLGRTPNLRELAEHLGATEPDVAIAMAAWRAHHPDSLDALPPPARGRPLADTIGAVDIRFDTVVDRQALRPVLAALPQRQQRILALRFFGEMSQAEIAAEVGLSQMHISRLLRLTLTQLRAGMLTHQGKPLTPPPAGGHRADAGTPHEEPSPARRRLVRSCRRR